MKKFRQAKRSFLKPFKVRINNLEVSNYHLVDDKKKPHQSHLSKNFDHFEILEWLISKIEPQYCEQLRVIGQFKSLLNCSIKHENYDISKQELSASGTPIYFSGNKQKYTQKNKTMLDVFNWLYSHLGNPATRRNIGIGSSGINSVIFGRST